MTKLWGKYGIEPVIDIRNLRKDVEKTKPVRDRDNVVHDYKGTVCCYSSKGRKREMVAGRFVKDSETLKYLCHAQQYGVQCPDKDACPIKSRVRIPLREDRRVFTPFAGTRPSGEGLW